ncbi:MAG: hypothetical protein WCJ64_18215, partial [Rhodospirillaceae bacterium]
MTTRDNSQDRFPGAPPQDLDALAEQEEMARLMKTLRDSIPYDEDEVEDGPEPVGAEPAYALPAESASAGGEGDGGEGSPEDDFARLLRTLREGIPDDPEPLEPLDDLPPYDHPHRYEPPESG